MRKGTNSTTLRCVYILKTGQASERFQRLKCKKKARNHASKGRGAEGEQRRVVNKNK